MTSRSFRLFTPLFAIAVAACGGGATSAGPTTPAPPTAAAEPAPAAAPTPTEPAAPATAAKRPMAPGPNQTADGVVFNFKPESTGKKKIFLAGNFNDWNPSNAQYLMTDPVWNGGIGETRKIANMAEAFGVPIVLHNVAGPFCHAAALHLGAHLPNLAFVESVRAFYRSYFAELADYVPAIEDSHFALPEGPGLGVRLREAALARPDVSRQVSEGNGLAVGRRAMGDHWEREEIR